MSTGRHGNIISESDFFEKYHNHELWLKNPNDGYRLDLSGLDLAESVNNFDKKIEGLNFSKSLCANTFFPTDLRNVNFQNADLYKADLSSCNLHNTNFENTSLNGANFRDATFGSNVRAFRNADLTNAVFENSNLNMVFVNTNLTNTEFLYCDFKNSVFNKAKLINTNFGSSTLKNCVFDSECLVQNVTFQDCPSLKSFIENQNLTLANKTAKEANEKKNGTTMLDKNGKPIEVSIPEQQSSDKFFSMKPSTKEFLKNSITNGVKTAFGNKASDLIKNNLKKALVKAGIPVKFLNNPAVDAMITLCAPQLLVAISPYVPKLGKSTTFQTALELACVSSIAKVSDDGITYALDVLKPMIVPMLKELNSSELKKGLKELEKQNTGS